MSCPQSTGLDGRWVSEATGSPGAVPLSQRSRLLPRIFSHSGDVHQLPMSDLQYMLTEHRLLILSVTSGISVLSPAWMGRPVNMACPPCLQTIPTSAESSLLTSCPSVRPPALTLALPPPHHSGCSFTSAVRSGHWPAHPPPGASHSVATQRRAGGRRSGQLRSCSRPTHRSTPRSAAPHLRPGASPDARAWPWLHSALLPRADSLCHSALKTMPEAARIPPMCPELTGYFFTPPKKIL